MELNFLTGRFLVGVRVVNLSVNLPGPWAAAWLRSLGASVIKIEPPSGDPAAAGMPPLYEALSRGIERMTLDLKHPEQRQTLFDLLNNADVLLTSSRPSALDRMGVSYAALKETFPRLCYVSIVGYATPRREEPGHDLTYQARAGTLTPPQLPRVLVADLAGAERAVLAALALLYQRERTGCGGYAEIALCDAALDFGVTARLGITTDTGYLGGALPNYNLYETAEGWLACGALEPHFVQRFLNQYPHLTLTHESWANLFRTRTADEWEEWGRAQDIPLVAVRIPSVDFCA